MRVATEHMVRAIEEITLHQGIDPRTAVLVGGGGAAGLNSVAIARRLGCSQLIVPAVGPALSAAGALLSDLTADFAATLVTTTADFDVAAVERTVADLRRRCEEFAAAAGARRRDRALGGGPLSASDLGARASRARATRRGRSSEATSTPSTRRCSRSAIQARRSSSSAGARESAVGLGAASPAASRRTLHRASAPPHGAPTSPVSGQSTRVFVSFDELEPGRVVAGPAIVESAVTTVVVDPGATVERTASGSLAIVPVAATASQTVGAVAT